MDHLYFHNLHYEKFPDGTVKCIEDEIPFELPEGWEWTRLESVFKLSSGKAIKVRQLEDDGEYPVYGGNGINGLYSMYNVESETIIIGRVGFYCGSVYKTTSQAWVTDNALIASITEPSFYQIDFLCNLLKYLDLGKTSVSTAQPVVSGKGIYPLLVPIPPLDEQKRIVTKLNDCVSIVDVLESDNSDLQTTIQLTKSKILDLAIRGKLVPQNPDDEPASVLLDRIRTEKEELIKQGKIKRDKKESVIFKGDDNSYYEVIASKTTNIDDDLPFELPDGWEWCRLGSIMDICSSKRVLQSEWKKEGVPFYRAREIVKLSETGRVDNDLFISEEHYQNLKKDYGIPKSGDLMVSGVGTIGKVYIVCENDKFYYKDASVLCFQNTYNALYPLYAKLLIDSSFMQKQMSDNSKGTTVDTITISTATTYLCILPPINEQKRIADKVSQLFSLLDSIAENVN